MANCLACWFGSDRSASALEDLQNGLQLFGQRVRRNYRFKNFSRAATMAGGQRRTVLTQSRSL